MTQDEQFRCLIEVINDDGWMMQVLEHVRNLNLVDCWIGAGFVRNKIWDHLHGFTTATVYDDVDVIYFDAQSNGNDKQQELALQTQLKQQDDTVNWSVKSQVRMQLIHGHQPYENCEQAISYWVETATCIGVRLTHDDQLQFIAPVGLDDLFGLILRKNPRSTIDQAGFLQRVERKQWLEKWPLLTLQS